MFNYARSAPNARTRSGHVEILWKPATADQRSRRDLEVITSASTASRSRREGESLRDDQPASDAGIPVTTGIR